jgi:spore germination protein GerM
MATMRLPIALMALALVTMAGCGGDDDDDAVSSSTEPPPDATEVTVYFVNEARFNAGTEPYVDSVSREVDSENPMQGAVDALFVGPLDSEEGLIFVASGATGAEMVSFENGVATVQLAGECASGGSTLTIANELIPTLKDFDDVTTVKILDAAGETETPEGVEDSIPVCLEP